MQSVPAFTVEVRPWRGRPAPNTSDPDTWNDVVWHQMDVTNFKNEVGGELAKTFRHVIQEMPQGATILSGESSQMNLGVLYWSNSSAADSLDDIERQHHEQPIPNALAEFTAALLAERALATGKDARLVSGLATVGVALVRLYNSVPRPSTRQRPRTGNELADTAREMWLRWDGWGDGSLEGAFAKGIISRLSLADRARLVLPLAEALSDIAVAQHLYRQWAKLKDAPGVLLSLAMFSTVWRGLTTPAEFVDLRKLAAEWMDFAQPTA